MGSLRSTAQIISYELILSSTILIVILLAGSLNFTKIISLQETNPFILPLLPIFLIFFISALAETNRAPMDLAEAESELTAGFFTEHSSTVFVFFFLAEYTNIILISTLGTLFFLGGYNIPGITFADITPFIPLTQNIIIQNLIYGLVIGFKVNLLIFIFI